VIYFLKHDDEKKSRYFLADSSNGIALFYIFVDYRGHHRKI